MKVLSGIIFAWSIRACLSSLGRSINFLSGPPGVDMFLPEDFKKMPKYIRSVFNDALARNVDPAHCRYKFRPLVMSDWDKDAESIVVMVNEAAHMLRFVEFVKLEYPGHLNVPAEFRKTSMAIIRDLVAYSEEVLTLAGQKLYEMELEVSSWKEEQSLEQQKDGQGIGFRRNNSYRKVNLISDSGKLKGLKRHIQGLRKSTFESAKDKMKSKLLGVKDDPQGTTEPLLGPDSLKCSSSDLYIERAATEVGVIQDNQTAQERITSGLRDCLLKMTPQISVIVSESVTLKNWNKIFEKSVFQLIEYMYKYKFIGPKELSNFYEVNPRVLNIAGKHISHVLGPWDGNFRFPYKPEKTYKVMKCELDYMRHSLGGLDAQSQGIIINTVFSDISLSLGSYMLSSRNLNWHSIPQNPENIGNYLTYKQFLMKLSKWNSEGAGTINEKMLRVHVVQLIKNITNPPHPKSENETFFLKHLYLFDVFILEYIIQNILDKELLLSFFARKFEKYTRFNNMFNLIMNGQRIVELHERLNEYKSFQTNPEKEYISEKQLNNEMISISEEMNSLGENCHQLMLWLVKDEDSCNWIENLVIGEIICHFAKLSEDFKWCKTSILSNHINIHM